MIDPGAASTTHPSTPSTLEASASRSEGGPRSQTARGAVVAGLVVGLVHWVVTRGITIPSSYDEHRHLAIARTLTGEVDFDTAGLTYFPGYGTLLAPVHWVTDDPAVVLHSALALNSVLAGVAAALLVVLLRRVTAAPAWSAVIASILATTVAGSVYQGTWAAPEELLATLFVATLLSLVTLLEHPSFGRGSVAVLLATASFAAHGRHGTLLVTVCAVVVVLAVRTQLDRRSAVALVVLALVGGVVAQRYATWVIDTTWVSTRSSSRAGSVFEGLGRPLGVLQSLLGMTWYQLVTTAGVAAAGAWAIGRSLATPQPDSDSTLSRANALVLAAALVPIAGVTALFMTPAQDAMPWAAQFVYGRYWEAISAVVIALGVLALLEQRVESARRAALVGVVSVPLVGCLLWATRQDDIDASIGTRESIGFGRRILGLTAYVGRDDQALGILEITGVATLLAGAILLVVASRAKWPDVGRLALPPLLTVLTIVSFARADTQLEGRWDLFAGSVHAPEVIQDGVVEKGQPLWFDSASLGRGRWHAYQHQLPHNPVSEYVAGAVEADAYVFAGPRGALRRAGASPVWADPDGEVVLWRLPADD